MKYSVAFALLGTLMCYWAVSSGGWWYLLLWFGISCFTMSAGYAGLGPEIFRKRPDGTIPLWVKIIHFPFLLYSACVWRVTQTLSHENPYDRVEDDLIIGRRLRGKELPRGVVNFVDLTAEFEDAKEIRQSTNYVSMPILDAGVPKTDTLDSVISQLSPGMTYVHCAQGHGRTSLFTLALLARRGRIKSFDDGMTLLKQVRPGIGLNKTQEQFIRSYVAEQLD